MGLFSGFSVSQSAIVVNHLHYAYDTIFFLDNNKKELHNLFSVLNCFELFAGLKVNTTKTRLIYIGNVPDLTSWALELGCATDFIPFMYLGMPLGANSNSKALWDPILVNFDTRLSFWNQRSVSKGGKQVLIRFHAAKDIGGLGALDLRLMT